MLEIPPSAGVVVDLDDTLYPERSFHESGFRWIAGRTGLDPAGPEVREACHALRSGGRPLDLLSHASGVPVETLLKWHREHPPVISVYPDAERFLALLRDAEIPVVLLTDGRSATQWHKVDALGIRRAFAAVLISDETGLSKIDANAFRNAASLLPGHNPIAYFGDNPAKDVEHPTSMGWQVFLMLDRGDNVHPQQVVDADRRRVRVLRTFDDITVSINRN